MSMLSCLILAAKRWAFADEMLADARAHGGVTAEEEAECNAALAQMKHAVAALPYRPVVVAAGDIEAAITAIEGASGRVPGEFDGLIMSLRASIASQVPVEWTRVPGTVRKWSGQQHNVQNLPKPEKQA